MYCVIKCVKIKCVLKGKFASPVCNVLNWVTQCRTTASIVNKKPSGHPQTVRTLEIMCQVSHAFQRRPQRSASRLTLKP
jgi:hypothetical protein